jgi:GTPase SAR1 family protein
VLENESVEEVHFKSVIFVDETTLYRINYWDLPGSERYLPLISRYCAGSTCTVFMFDASRRTSFERIEKWINEVERTEVLTKVLIGNKADLMGTKKGATNVDKTEAVALARQYGMEYFEISSLQEQSLA